MVKCPCFKGAGSKHISNPLSLAHFKILGSLFKNKKEQKPLERPSRSSQNLEVAFLRVTLSCYRPVFRAGWACAHTFDQGTLGSCCNNAFWLSETGRRQPQEHGPFVYNLCLER